MIKVLKKVRIDGMLVNIIKAIYKKTYVQYSYSKWRTTEIILAKVRNKTGMSAFPTPIQYSFGITR
jgi:hypothetical protein